MKKRRPQEITEAREWRAYRSAVFQRNLAYAAVLRELRRLVDCTQGYVAGELGVSVNSIANWESGRIGMNEKRQREYRRAIDRWTRAVQKRSQAA